MNNAAFSFYSNVFAFVMGGISLLGLAFTLTRPHLPSNKIKTLQTLLEETEKIYVSAVEEGLLLDPRFSDTAKQQLSSFQSETHDLRARVYGITTFFQDCTLMLSGLSRSIGRMCTKVKQLRADVITTSEAARLRMQPDSAIFLPPAQVTYVDTSDRSDPDICLDTSNRNGRDIRRPRSCPPIVCGATTTEQTSIDPFADPVSRVSQP